MNKLGAFFNIITNKVIQIQPAQRYPVIQRYANAFILWYTSVYTLTAEAFALNPCYFTDIVLWRLYRHFDHSLIHGFHYLLEQSGYNVKLQVLYHLTKYCEH